MNKVEYTPDRSAHRVDVPETAEHVPSSEAASAEDRFYTHLLTVLSVSSGMVGVCLTAIGLVGIEKSLNQVETIVDLLTIGSLVFMLVAVLSFLGMRTNIAKKWGNFARTMDLAFCLSLVLVVIAHCLSHGWSCDPRPWPLRFNTLN